MSQGPPTKVSVTRHFNASPERVFDAFLDPMKIAVWMLGPEEGEATRVEVDPRVGGAFTFVIRRHGVEVEHVGEYRELARPNRLVFTWGVPQLSAESTVVAIGVGPDGAGASVTLDHEGVLPDDAERTTTGWTAILGAVDASLGL